MSVHQKLKKKNLKEVWSTDDIGACKIVMNQTEKIMKTRDKGHYTCKLTRFGWNKLVGIYKRNTGTEMLYGCMSNAHGPVSTFSETWTLEMKSSLKMQIIQFDEEWMK